MSLETFLFVVLLFGAGFFTGLWTAANFELGRRP